MNEEEKETVETKEEAQPQAQPVRITLNEKDAKNTYCNFSYSAGTRQGVLTGYGMHDWQFGRPVRVDSKIEMSYFNAKRFLSTLNEIIKKHEGVFGEVETDVNKRIKKEGE